MRPLAITGDQSMASKDLPKFVYQTKNRHGTRRLRFRRGRFQRWLPNADSSDFYLSYAQALKDSEVKKSPHQKYSLEWVIADYQFNNNGYKSLSVKTKSDKNALYVRLIKAWGKDDIRQLTRPALIKMLDGVHSDTTHKRMLIIFRQLLQHALDRGYINKNVATTIKNRDTTSEAIHPWTLQERRGFERFWPSGSRERLAYELMFCACQGSADASRMGKFMIKGGAIQGTRVKTGVPYVAPISHKLAKELKQWRTQLVFILNQQGKPFSERGFHNWFSKAISKAGLPNRCTPHGLRGAGCTELADSGCTANEIMAIAGFKTMSQAQRYVEQANKKKLAESGSEKRFLSNPDE